MKRLLLAFSFIVGAWVLSPTMEAEAEGRRGWQKSKQTRQRQMRHRQHRGRHAVPELDPGAAGAAVVLLLGGVAYIASRRREEDAA